MLGLGIGGGMACIELSCYFVDHSYSSSVKMQISLENCFLLSNTYHFTPGTGIEEEKSQGSRGVSPRSGTYKLYACRSICSPHCTPVSHLPNGSDNSRGLSGVSRGITKANGCKLHHGVQTLMQLPLLLSFDHLSVCTAQVL